MYIGSNPIFPAIKLNFKIMDKTGIELLRKMIEADLAFFNYMNPDATLTYDELLDMIPRDKKIDGSVINQNN